MTPNKSKHVLNYSRLGPVEREYVNRYLMTLGELPEMGKGSGMEQYEWRLRVCARFFQGMSECFAPSPWTPMRGGFSSQKVPRLQGSAKGYDRLKVIFVGKNLEDNAALQHWEIRERLFSYVYCLKDIDLKTLVETGLGRAGRGSIVPERI